MQVRTGRRSQPRKVEQLRQMRALALPLGYRVLAQQHGFVSASHFSRIFREEFGTTPRQWRNNTTPRPDETQDESRLDRPQQIRPEETY